MQLVLALFLHLCGKTLNLAISQKFSGMYLDTISVIYSFSYLES